MVFRVPKIPNLSPLGDFLHKITILKLAELRRTSRKADVMHHEKYGY